MMQFNKRRAAGLGAGGLPQFAFIPYTLKDGRPWKLIDIAKLLFPFAERWSLEELIVRSGGTAKMIVCDLELNIEPEEISSLDPDKARAILKEIAGGGK